MTTLEKRAYNKEYYRKNRDKVLNRAKSKYRQKKSLHSNVVPLFSSSDTGKANSGMGPREPEFPQKGSKFTQRISFGTIFLQLLVVCMTFFLVVEISQFYASSEGGVIAPYFKALLLEGSVIAFTLIQARTRLVKTFYRIMICLIYLFSTWVLSGSVLSSAAQQHKEALIQNQIVTELESEIKSKTELRESLFKSERITLALKIDRTLEELKKKLEKNQEVLIKTPRTAVIWNTLITLVVFRILVMVANIVCLQELARRYRIHLKTV